MRIVGAISTALSFKALSISPIILSVELGSSELRFSVQLIGCALSVIIGSSFLHKRGFASFSGNRRLTCCRHASVQGLRSEEHTSELQSLMRKSYPVFCLKKNNTCQCKTTIKSTHRTSFSQ